MASTKGKSQFISTLRSRLKTHIEGMEFSEATKQAVHSVVNNALLDVLSNVTGETEAVAKTPRKRRTNSADTGGRRRTGIGGGTVSPISTGPEAS